MKTEVYEQMKKGKAVLIRVSVALVAGLVFCWAFPAKGAVINCYPQQIDYWTGTCSASAKTQISLIQAVGGGGVRAWMKFDLTNIPDGSTINSINLKFYITARWDGTPYHQIRRVTADPVTASPGTLFNQISSGQLYSQFTSNISTGWNTRALGGTAVSDLQSSLAADWICVGLWEYEGSPSYYIYAEGWNQTNKPYLEVNYTTNFINDIAVDSITSPINLSCEGQWPVKVKLLNGGINNITSTTISWSINGLVQPSVPWAGTLTPGATTIVTLGNYNFAPGNVTITVQASLPNGQNDPFMVNNSKNYIVQFIPKPSVYIQPVDQSIAIGGNATFSTVSSGGNITYQWQLSTDNGLTFANLSNTPPYSNVSTNNLLITNATLLMNGYKFRCIVTGTCPPPAITDTVLLSVGPPINAVIGQGYACPGGSSTVAITATNVNNAYGIKMTIDYNPAAVTYSGYSSVHALLLANGTINVTNTPGQVVVIWTGTNPVTIASGTLLGLVFSYTSNTPVSFNTTPSSNTQFTGLGGVAYPASYTNGAMNNGTPVIQTQPSDLMAIVGVPGSLSVVSIGSPTYQWQISIDGGLNYTNLINNPTYSGVNDPTLWVNLPTLTMSGYKFRCVLTGCTVSVTSNAATLTVIKLLKTWIDTIYSCPGPLPCTPPYPTILVPFMVDNFDSISSFSLSIFYKNTALLYDGWQDLHPGITGYFVPHNVSGSPGLYDNFRVAGFNAVGYMTIPNGEAMFNLRFKVLCDTTKLTWETWTGGACQYSAGLTTFDAEFINGYVLNGGPFVLTNPLPQTKYTGETATFTASGNTFDATLAYQWQLSTDGGANYADIVNNAIYSGTASPTLSVICSLVTMNGYKYRCKISGKCAPVYTTGALLTVNSPPIYVTAASLNACAGDTIYVPVTVTNFAQVCSFSLKLKYVGSQLEFAGFADRNTSLPNLGNFMINDAVDTVIMNWWSLSPGTIAGTGTLVKLKFVASGLFTNSQLTWKTVPPSNCMITNCAASTITSTFINGSVSVNTLPQPHNMYTTQPANGHFCAGSLGAPVGVDITQTGVNYTLYREGTAVTGAINIPGTGFGYTFGTYPVPGHYTVVGTSATTGCSRLMDGAVDVVADPPPVVYTITGGGAYCTSGTGNPVGLSLSQTNVDYVLLLNGAPVDTLSGTGSPLSYGNQTAPGTYTISAKNAFVETCPTLMNGSAVISINPYPDPASAINGPAEVCQGTTLNYNVTPIANASFYVWTLPTGATGTSTNTTIPVTFTTTAISGFITVKGQNGCGFGTPSNLSILVNPLPVAAAAISGPNTACQGATEITYSVPDITNATSYIWSLPSGVIGSSTTNTIIVNVGTGALTGPITVKGHNGCGDGPSSSLLLTVSPLPGPASMITGSQTPCQGAPTVFYSTSSISNATSYIWSLPTGATGTSSTSTITVSYSITATSGTISVKGHNACGDGTPFSIPVNMTLLPTAAGPISGPVSVCKGTNGVAYAITAVPNTTDYVWTQPGGINGSSTTFNISLNFTMSATSGNITVKAHNTCGYGAQAVLPITVNNLPTVTQSNFPIICVEGGNYTLTGGSPTGGTYSGTGVTNGVFNPSVQGVGTWPILYTYSDPTTSCLNSITKNITVSLFPRILGTVKYDNAAATTMGNVKVYLKNASNVVIDSTLSNVGLGDYMFRCLTNNTTYNLSAKTTRPWTESDVTSVDALIAAKVGVGLETLSAFRTVAGDLNQSNTVNAGDAVMIMRRWVGLSSSFPIGNWVFDYNNPATVVTTDVTKNIRALLAGDLNASHVPSGAKMAPTVFLNKKGIQIVDELDVVSLPVRTTEALETGAFSLAINYPGAALEMLEVKSKLEGMIYNVMDNQIRIAWYSLQPVRFSKDEAVITLTVRMNNELENAEELKFEADAGSEFAGSDAVVLPSVKLTLPEVRTSGNSDGVSAPVSTSYLGANHPNPFNQITLIDYGLAEEGDVRLSILNLLGEEVTVLVNERQSAGPYKVTFHSDGLAPGVYLYKLVVKGAKNHFVNTRTMVVKD